MLRAFHSNWTRPFTARFPNTPYAVEPFELLTTMLSALQWRRLGGVISMETDHCGASYYAAMGLTALWNGGVRDSLEGAVPDSVPPSIFWAAGKLYALRQMRAPCVMLDTDFIVWRDFTQLCQNADAAVIHFEDISPDIYPAQDQFHLAPGFALSSLDWMIRPSNTALACFLDDTFRQSYVKRAISFMEHAPQAEDPLTYMVFAEQRILSMCASEAGARLIALSDLPALFGSGQQYFTHVWGYKQHLRENPTAYDAFCRRCAKRIMRDYTAFAPLAAAIPSLRAYFS